MLALSPWLGFRSPVHKGCGVDAATFFLSPRDCLPSSHQPIQAVGNFHSFRRFLLSLREAPDLQAATASIKFYP